VEQYVILARSVTYAQRMQKLLGKAGIHTRIFRAPRELTDLGCAYILRVQIQFIRQALDILHSGRMDPLRVFFEENGSYREVRLHDLL
jgi:hypothetical protein